MQCPWFKGLTKSMQSCTSELYVREEQRHAVFPAVHNPLGIWLRVGSRQTKLHVGATIRAPRAGVATVNIIAKNNRII